MHAECWVVSTCIFCDFEAWSLLSVSSELPPPFVFSDLALSILAQLRCAGMCCILMNRLTFKDWKKNHIKTRHFSRQLGLIVELFNDTWVGPLPPLRSIVILAPGHNASWPEGRKWPGTLGRRRGQSHFEAHRTTQQPGWASKSHY